MDQDFQQFAEKVREASGKSKTYFDHAIKLLNQNGWQTIRSIPLEDQEQFITDINNLTGVENDTTI